MKKEANGLQGHILCPIPMHKSLEDWDQPPHTPTSPPPGVLALLPPREVSIWIAPMALLSRL